MKDPVLTKAVKGFSKLKVLCIGDLMLDTYYWGRSDRMSPEAPVPIVSIDKKDHRLGGAGNVALNIKALGATPYLCSVIGRDDAGDKILSLLKEHGISTDGILQSDSRITTEKVRIFSKHQQMLRYDTEVTEPLSKSETNKLVLTAFQYLNNSQVTLFQDYDKGVIHPLVIQSVISEANHHRVPVVVDPKFDNFMAYKNVTLFKPNLVEMSTVYKDINLISDGPEADHSMDSIAKAARSLRASLKNEHTFITLGSKGIFVDTIDEHKLVPANTIEVADVSGAGDTVISVAALSIASQLDIFKTAELSNMAAGRVCQEVGVIPIYKDQLLEMLN
ncbi:MAG: D-glycero-beta-D-manno-heptose-7-phosphate kinase [Bacteroidetes bacterium]|nr:D-glycero-beta-D-manno-heptose-7-phosphate kinase [Bacteroidota bacterium]